MTSGLFILTGNITTCIAALALAPWHPYLIAFALLTAANAYMLINAGAWSEYQYKKRLHQYTKRLRSDR